jgi:regulatory protein YycH of two-component signal transduction system YycFG
VPVDSTGRFSECYEVYYEDEIPWDIYLTKVDLKNGIYGDYVFYKLQLLIDRNRDLYVVFTRWGRIGESGMN